MTHPQPGPVLPPAGGQPLFGAAGWRRRALRARRGLVLLALLTAGLGLAWRATRYLAGFPIWGDEASLVMSLLSRDYAGMLRPPLEVNQIAPLGYLWLELALSRMLGLGEWVLRLPAWVASLASVPLLWWLARRLLDRRGALLALAIFAASYYPVRHGAEVKPYSLDLLAGLGLTALAWRAGRRPDSLGRWAALTLTAAIAVWMSLPSVFVVGGAGLYLAWVVLRRPTAVSLAGLSAYAVLAGASFVAMYLLWAKPLAAASPRYFGETSQWAGSWPPVRKPWRLPLWLLDAHTGNMLAYPVGGKHGGSAATSLLVAAGCVALWKRGRRGVVFLLLGPMLLNLLAAFLGKYPYAASARTTLFLAPAFCLLAGLGLSRLLGAVSARLRGRPALVPAAAGVLAAVALVGAAMDVMRPFKDRRYVEIRNSVRTAAAQTSAKDQWIVANSLLPSEDSPALSGSGIQTFRYYAALLSPAPVSWGPSLDSVRPVDGTTWLLYYEDPLATTPREQAKAKAYIRAIQERLGPSQEQGFLIHNSDGSRAPRALTVYRFDRRRSASGPAEAPPH